MNSKAGRKIPRNGDSGETVKEISFYQRQIVGICSVNLIAAHGHHVHA